MKYTYLLARLHNKLHDDSVSSSKIIAWNSLMDSYLLLDLKDNQ